MLQFTNHIYTIHLSEQILKHLLPNSSNDVLQNLKKKQRNPQSGTRRYTLAAGRGNEGGVAADARLVRGCSTQVAAVGRGPESARGQGGEAQQMGGRLTMALNDGEAMGERKAT